MSRDGHGAAVLERGGEHGRKSAERPEAGPGAGADSRASPRNGLSLAAFGFFLVCLLGQVLTGVRQYKRTSGSTGRRPSVLASISAAVTSSRVTFENWESEFLQMAAFVS